MIDTKAKFKLKLSLIISSLLLVTTSCLANVEKEPALINNQPITIDADNQEIDIQNNMITFTGNVVIIQDELKILAAKVVIDNMQNQSEQKVTAYGSPVYFTQVLENRQQIEGQARQLSYDVKQSSITLTGKAFLKQQDNTISSETIVYKVNEQQISAKGNATNRVKTVILPNQLKETNK